MGSESQQDEEASPRIRPSWPSLSGPREALDTITRWAWKHRYEIAAAALVFGVAAFLRLYRLDTVPPGLHIDEAANALWADDILHGRWAGPYDPFRASGRPAGFGFWLAGVTALVGNSIFDIRFAVALLAILTIVVAYFLYRVIDGPITAVIGSSLLALSNWHLTFSRMAWEPAMLVLAEVTAALSVLSAIRHRRPWLFLLAGFVLGLGVYSHNSYPFFLVAMAVVLAAWLVSQQAEFRRALLDARLLVSAFLLTVLPFVSYLVRNERVYTGRAQRESIFNSTRYEEASGFGERADVILDNGRDFVQFVVFDGARDVPMLAVATSVLLGFGVLLALARWREPGIGLAVVLLFVLPWAAILTTSGATIMVRRAIGVTPFIALLAALPLATVLRSRHLSKPTLRAGALVVATAAIASVGMTNVGFYFRDYADSPTLKATMNPIIVRASEYMDALPEGSYVYFYSERWPFANPVRQYLAPEAQGEDRSGLWQSEFDLTADRSRNVVFIFLDAFLEQGSEVERLYPGGVSYEALGDEGVLFRSYALAAREAPTDPAARDLNRLEDLSALAEALTRYRSVHDAYPSTTGRIEALCVFEDDAGCALMEILSLPTDPLGGTYWYQSDGSAFVIYAVRESTAADECEETPPLEGTTGSYLCVASP